MSTGQQLRDAGMAQVIENAGLWKSRAGDAIDEWFAEVPPGEAFTGEQVRMAILPIVGKPHHHNAWGAVIGVRVRAWLKAQRIVVVGITPASMPSNHARMMRRYRKTLTGGPD